MKQDSECRTLDKILKFADIQGKEVLEIGCGDGRITSQLVSKAKRLVAIDPDAESIAEATIHVRGGDVRIGSGEHLEFPSACFDVILFTLSLHHQDSGLALREAKRVLRDGGRVLILEPVNDGEIERVCNVLRDETQALEDVLHAIDASDLEVERSEVFYTNWVFENDDELYGWLSEYYQMPFDSDLVARVGELLGEKLESQPIVLEDKMMIMSLRKRIAQD